LWILAATAALAGEEPTARLVVTGPTVLDDGASSTAVFGIEVLDGAGPITFDYATEACTAGEGQDFAATAGSAAIPEGVQSWTVDVGLFPPSGEAREGFETFRLRLSNVFGAALEGGDAEALLVDIRPVSEPTKGDVDGDSDADVWVEYTQGDGIHAPKRVVVWNVHGTGVTPSCLSGALLDPEGWVAADVADFDEDGSADLLWWHPSGELGFTVAGSDTPAGFPPCAGGRANELPPVPVIWDDTSIRVVGTGRFSGLGIDIVTFDPSTRQIRLVPIDPHLERGPELVLGTTPDPNWSPIGTGDFDASGTTDLLLRNSVSGRHVIWFYDGLVRTGGQPLSPDKPADSNWVVVGSGDYNGDGHADLLLQNKEPESQRLVLWFLRNGVRTCGSFLEPDRLDLPEYPGPWLVVH
jgi:hypothetical protein